MKPEYALNRFMQFDSSAGRPTSVLLASLVRCDRAKRAAGWEPQFSHSACDFPSAGKRVIDVAAPRATVTDTSITRYQSDRVQLVTFLEMIVPFGTMTSQPSTVRITHARIPMRRTSPMPVSISKMSQLSLPSPPKITDSQRNQQSTRLVGQ